MRRRFTNLFLSALCLLVFQQVALAQCADPTGLNVGAITETQVEIGFTSTSGGTTTASVCPSGTTPPDASCITASPFSSSGTVMGLTACTDYDTYVQDDCGAMGMSALVGPVAFTTSGPPTNLLPACGETVTHPACLDAYGVNDNITWTLTPSAGMVVVMNFTYVDIETSSNATGGDCGCGCWDRVTMNAGGDVTGPLCGEGDGDGQTQGGGAGPGIAAGDCFFSEVADEAVTITFESDGSVQETGFSFVFTCVPLATAETTCATSLPTSLISFSGTPMVDGNKLTWKTAFEDNTEWHIIERSNDGVEWTEIGRLAGAGYSIQETTYEFMDEKPLSKGFYRVKFEDFNKTAVYTTMLILKRNTQAFRMDKVFPNPAVDLLTAQFESDRNTDVVVKVTDLVGRVISTHNFEANDGMNTYELNVSDMAQGIYFLQLDNGTEVLTERFLKK